MKIVVIGTGYVGLVSGTCFAELGHKVICIDKDSNKINSLTKGIIPIYEPGLEDLVKKNFDNGNLQFSTELKEPLHNADCVFLAVGTPTDEKTGNADLQYIFAAAEEIAENLDHETVIVTKSTVPVGTSRKIGAIFNKKRPELKCEIASNPEFLREGSAVYDFLNPDRVIVGTSSEKARLKLVEVYRPFIENGIPFLFTTRPTAELIKYASNAFLATKIAFINEIADICEKTDANIEDVTKGMGLDKRIREQHLKPGPGYGGSCFPKDTLALRYISEQIESPSKIVNSVIDSNNSRKFNLIDKVTSELGNNLSNLKITVLGLTFKANTDDVRYSPAFDLIPQLIDKGASVTAYDPAGIENFKNNIGKLSVKYSNSLQEAYEKSDCLIILTEWQEFAEIDLASLKNQMNNAIIFDMRNLYTLEKMKNHDFKYISIGREKITN